MSEAYPRLLPPHKGALHRRTLTQVQRRGRALVAAPRAQFLVMTMAPTVLAALYYGVVASPLYVSHSEYIVRGVDERRTGGLAQLLNTFGVSRAADETSAIESFLKSREVLERIAGRVDLRAIYGAREADLLARFPRFWERDSFESLFAYTRGVIDVAKDNASGVTRLDVAAFDPRAAQAVAGAMLATAGEMANSLNARAQADLVDASRRELEIARDEVIAAQEALTVYRNQALLIDPLAFAGAMLQEIGTLSLERARTQAQLSEAVRLSPNSPALDAMKASAAALERKVAEERGKLAGDDSALAGKVAQYERLTLTRELAEKRYAAALLSLQTAQTDAARKRVYVEEIVRPNLPDEATAPSRLRNVASTFVVGFIAFAILWILSVGSRDHAQ